MWKSVASCIQHLTNVLSHRLHNRAKLLLQSHDVSTAISSTSALPIALASRLIDSVHWRTKSKLLTSHPSLSPSRGHADNFRYTS